MPSHCYTGSIPFSPHVSHGMEGDGKKKVGEREDGKEEVREGGNEKKGSVFGLGRGKQGGKERVERLGT